MGDFGIRLKKIRMSNNLTQQDLADMLFLPGQNAVQGRGRAEESLRALRW